MDGNKNGVMATFKNHSAAIIVPSLFSIAVILCSCQSQGTGINPAAPASSTTTPPISATTPGDTTSTLSGTQIPKGTKWAADGVISEGEYQQTKTYGDLDINCSNDNQFVYIGLKAKTAGWIAIGFGSDGMMKNMDIVEGLVKDGKTSVYDMFSIGDFGPHPADIDQGGTDDIVESAATSANDVIVVEFKRKFDTGDKFDKPLVTGNNRITWAYCSNNQIFLKHANRGYGEIIIK